MNIKDYLKEKGENVLFYEKFSVKVWFQNKIASKFLLILFWLAFDIFFVYSMFQNYIKPELMFLFIPIAGINLLALWILLSTALRIRALHKNEEFVVTDIAVYYIKDCALPDAKRISYERIKNIKYSEYADEGMYVVSEISTINIKNIKNLNKIYKYISTIIKS